MTCLILGANGYIGKHLCAELCKSGHHIIAFDRFMPESYISPSNVSWHKGHFADIDNLKPLIDEADVVYHLIASGTPSEDTSIISSEIVQDVIPTVQLLEYMHNYPEKRLVFLSSGGTVYRDCNLSHGVEDACEPCCSYGIQKRAIESYISLYNRFYSSGHIVVRLTNPYGLGQDKTRTQGLIPIMIQKLLKHEDVVLFGNTTRDYIYMDDAVTALVLIAEYKGDHRFFNVGTGVGHSVDYIVSELQSISGLCFKSIVHVPKRIFDVTDSRVDITNTISELGWRPKIELRQGLELLYSEIANKANK